MIGIYALSFEDEIVYVGQSKNIDRRLYIHRVKYPHLKQHIVCTIDTYDREFLNELEIAHIAFFGTYGKMNKTRGGAGTRDIVVSDETRQKLSEAARGKKLSEECKRKMSEARKGKMSEARKGKTYCEVLHDKQRSEEYKRKMSEAKKGKTYPNRKKPVSVWNKGLKGYKRSKK